MDAVVLGLLMAALVLGLLGTLVIAGPVAFGYTENGRRLNLMLSALLAASLVLMVPFARQDDSYYGSGVTRWEHATRGSGAGELTVILAIAAGAAVLTWIAAASRGRWSRGAPLAGLVSFLALSVAWFILGTGH